MIKLHKIDPKLWPQARLILCLREKGVSNEQIALDCGCHSNNISLWLRGASHAKFDKLALLMVKYNININDLGLSYETGNGLIN